MIIGILRVLMLRGYVAAPGYFLVLLLLLLIDVKGAR